MRGLDRGGLSLTLVLAHSDNHPVLVLRIVAKFETNLAARLNRRGGLSLGVCHLRSGTTTGHLTMLEHGLDSDRAVLDFGGCHMDLPSDWHRLLTNQDLATDKERCRLAALGDQTRGRHLLQRSGFFAPLG